MGNARECPILAVQARTNKTRSLQDAIVMNILPKLVEKKYLKFQDIKPVHFLSYESAYVGNNVITQISNPRGICE